LDPGAKENVMQVVWNDSPDSKVSSIKVDQWWQDLARFRDRTSLSIDSEDMGVLSPGTQVAALHPYLFQQSSSGQSLNFEFEVPQWDSVPAPGTIFWERLSPRTYFVVDLAKKSGQGTWVLCPEAPTE
jgi:hypothetical protein